MNESQHPVPSLQSSFWIGYFGEAPKRFGVELPPEYDAVEVRRHDHVSVNPKTLALVAEVQAVREDLARRTRNEDRESQSTTDIVMK